MRQQAVVPRSIQLNMPPLQRVLHTEQETCKIIQMYSLMNGFSMAEKSIYNSRAKGSRLLDIESWPETEEKRTNTNFKGEMY